MTSRRIFVALLTVLVALDVVILGIRVDDVFRFGRYLYVHAEGPVLYSVWKLRHGFPLYEWPARPFYALTLYNFLFYATDAAVLGGLRVSNEGMLMAGRFVTLAFGLAGAVAQYAAGRVYASRGFRVPLALLCVITWFGCLLPGIWSTTIRPDIAGAAAATAGVAIAIAALRANRRWPLALAGLAFLLAWAFKQSQVALFAATCAHVLVWRRSVTSLVLLAAPLVAGVAAAMAVGGAVYRANIVSAPALNPLVAHQAIFLYRSVALTDLLLWGMALYALVALVRPGSAHGPLRSIAGVPERSRMVFGADLTYPALAVLAAFAIGTPLLMKIGSGRNHLMELNVAASLTCAAVLGSVWETAKTRRVCAAGALMLLPMIAFSLTVLFNRPTQLGTALALKRDPEGLHLMTAANAEERRRLEALVEGLPQPAYVEDDVFALPWYSTGGRYPAFVIDHVFYDQAAALGLVGRGLEGLLADRYFASALVQNASPCYVVALHAGYRLVTTLPRQDDEPLRVLVRVP